MVKNNDGIRILESAKNKHPKNPILAFININSVRNKFDNLFCLVGNLVDILVIAETKLDSSFVNQILVREGFKSPFRLDVSSRMGGILVYIR